MKKIILLIEDKKNVRESLVHILEAKGFDVEQAANGKEGLKKLEKINARLVITDTSMPPGIDGYEICRQIKLVQKLDIPVIIYTATFEVIDPLKAKKSGADDFIVKGTDPEELFKAIDKVLKSRNT